jgi:hypothetical protein
MQSNQVTPSTSTSFEIAQRGYAPAAVESSISRLVAELGALRTQAGALETEIGEVGGTRLAGEADTLAALDRAESMLRRAYADARATTAAAAAEAEQARAVARAEVAADLHRLDVEIADVNETAVESGARMVALARKRAAARIERDEVAIERAHEWAELIVTRARTRATACATAAVRELNANKEKVLDRRAIAAQRRRALEAAVAELRAETRRIDVDAQGEAARLRTAATAEADAVVAEAAGAAARLEAETDTAMAELGSSMELLKAELTSLRGVPAPAEPARASRAKSSTAKAEPKVRPAKAATADKPTVTRPAPAAKPAAKAVAAAKPAAKPATRKPAASRRAEPVAVKPVAAPAVEPTPIAPARAPVPLAPVAAASVTPRPVMPTPAVASVTAAPARITLSTAPVVVPAPQSRPVRPVVAGGATRALEPSQKTDGPGFVRLTPAPGAPARRVVPSAVPASAALVARRARRLSTASAIPGPELPKISAPTAGGPSCVSAATSTTSAVTVLRTARPHS